MAESVRKLAVITGASTGIGYELAKQCAEHAYDLIIVADEPKIHEAAHYKLMVQDLNSLTCKTNLLN